jgi:hypothetical protein
VAAYTAKLVAHRAELAQEAAIAQGESVIKFPPPLNVLKDAYDHSMSAVV